MQNSLLVGLSRQMALGRELDVIANNLANVSTNGFRARHTRFEDHLMRGAATEGFRPGDRRPAYVIDAGTHLDLAPGAIESTGNPLDVAIKGDGFFAVETGAGERYTRNGAFQLDGTGRLVTSDGHPVLGEAGPIVFGPEETGISIAPDGTITTSQGVRGRIRLVRFEDAGALRSEGANTFSSPAPALPAGPLGRVEPAALERSNVRPILEMTRLMDVSRAYQSIAGLIGRMEEGKKTALSRLADVQAG